MSRQCSTIFAALFLPLIGPYGSPGRIFLNVWSSKIVAKKKNLNTVIAKPAHMGSGFQHQAGAGPPRCRGSATPWLACPYGGGGTQCKGLLSQQMASQVGQNHPKFEGGKVVSAVVMPPQAHRELQGKQNKTTKHPRSQ